MIPFDTAYQILSQLPEEIVLNELHINFSTYNKSRKYYDYILDSEHTEPVPAIDAVVIFQDPMDGSEDFLPYVDWAKAKEVLKGVEYDLMRGVV